MSLIKFLKFARSLRGGSDAAASYSLTQDNLVPDFHRSGSRPVSIAEGPDRAGRGRNTPDDKGRWRSKPTSPRPALRADAKGQLSLEFVKVVRNDLSDSDLEVIPAKSVVPRPPSPTPAPAPAPARVPVAAAAVAASARVSASTSAASPEGATEPLEPEASRWNRFTARLFRAETLG